MSPFAREIASELHENFTFALLTFITPRMRLPLEAALTTPISIYFDFGIYNAFISECACDGMPSQIAYFDDIRRGVSREEVGTR